MNNQLGEGDCWRFVSTAWSYTSRESGYTDIRPIKWVIYYWTIHIVHVEYLEQSRQSLSWCVIVVTSHVIVTSIDPLTLASISIFRTHILIHNHNIYYELGSFCNLSEALSFEPPELLGFGSKPKNITTSLEILLDQRSNRTCKPVCNGALYSDLQEELSLVVAGDYAVQKQYVRQSNS